MELYNLIGTINNYNSTLSTAISGSVDHIDLTSAAIFPSAGAVNIGTAVFVYTSKTGDTLNGELQAMGIISAGAEVVFTFTFDFIPENFEGVKITQKFSFVNPIGYTPKYSIDTLRVIADDKTTLDTVFLTYGLESDVTILIQKLNAAGTAYENLSTFAIDFESYEVFDVYSEFALKSISVIDDYNKVKNTEIQLTLNNVATLPNTQKFINYVSLKSLGKREVDNYQFIFKFEKNNEYKIYDSDSSLYNTDILAFAADEFIYRIGADEQSITDVILNISVTSTLKVITSLTQNLSIQLNKVSGISDTFVRPLIYSEIITPGTNLVDINLKTEINLGICLPNDFIYMNIYFSGMHFSSNTEGNIFIDIKKQTDVLVINSATEKIKYIGTGEVLSYIFNNNISMPQDPLFSFGLTSANHIQKVNDFVNIKPKDFLSDFCTMAGLLLNFKIDGTVDIQFQSEYFNNLFKVDIYNVPKNFVEVTNFKDVTKKYYNELNFASVSAGQEVNEYDIFTYLINWNKVLTFKQENRNASENLDLTLQKFRTDFSGILDYFYKRSKQNIKNSKDNFIFEPNFTNLAAIGEPFLYDFFTPRNILYNWYKFLSFAFQNFGKNTLEISSNGGTVDNFNVNGTNEMDIIAISSTPRLLPIEYNLTCLINEVDFSEKILKIEDVYLFVINSETTDQLNEQKIKGLQIEF